MPQRTVVQILDFVPRADRSMEQFLLALAGRLRGRGWGSVHVFAGEPGADFRRRLADLDSPYLVAPFPLTRRRGRQLGRHLRAFRPDAVHTHFVSKFDAGLRPLKAASGAGRLVVTDHSSGSASRKSAAGRAVAWVRGRWAGTYIDQLVAVSEFVRRRAVDGVYFPASKTRVVYNGVDTARYAPSGGPRRPGLTIAYVGQLIPEKGVLTLLRAVEILAAGGSGVGVAIAGEGPQAGDLRAFCDRAGLAPRVAFLGRVDRVDRLFAEADVVVVPSEWAEAFGLVAAEAAACGACVVASDAGGLPEVIGPDGGAGVIFARGDAAALARRLGELLADPARRAALGLNARDRAVSHFSIERMVDGYCRCYDEVAGPG